MSITMPRESRYLQFEVPSAHGGRPLGEVLRQAAHLKPEQVQELVGAGAVTVNGKRARGRRQPVQVGDRIRAPRKLPPEPQVSLTSRVLYRDEQLLVVDKPAGVAAAATPLGERGTLPALLARQLGLPRSPHVVHRLDRPVSGVMALALDRAGARELTTQFESGRARKEYYALVQGAPPRDQGRIEVPIGRDPGRRGRQRVDASGAPARTDYQVHERARAERPYSALWLRLHTGRTHQLRVHLAHLGCPILGDGLYGGPRQLTTAAGSRAVTRLCLHAARLTLEAPDGSPRVFEASLPAFLD